MCAVERSNSIDTGSSSILLGHPSFHTFYPVPIGLLVPQVYHLFGAAAHAVERVDRFRACQPIVHRVFPSIATINQHIALIVPGLFMLGIFQPLTDSAVPIVRNSFRLMPGNVGREHRFILGAIIA